MPELTPEQAEQVWEFLQDPHAWLRSVHYDAIVSLVYDYLEFQLIMAWSRETFGSNPTQDSLEEVSEAYERLIGEIRAKRGDSRA